MSKKTIQLISLSFDEVIVHTLPKHKKDQKEIEPKFSQQMSVLTYNLKNFFKEKIVHSLSSDKAIKLTFDHTNPSPISTLAKGIINKDYSKNRVEFIESSKKIAKHLFDSQMGSNNEGILVVVPCKINHKNALTLIKLEMDSGAQLVLNDSSKSYDIKEVEDLMLTKKTRIYKVTLLLNKTLQEVAYDGIVADHQIDTKAKDEVKSWFINKFLGCVPYKDPKITTQHFYNFTKAFIDTINDDIKKTKYHQDLNSYILKNSSIISPREFADDYLSNTDERNAYKDYLTEKKFGFDGFQKDTTQIERRINQVTLEFANNITITSKTGTFKGKVKFEKTEDGQTKAEIISRVKKVK